MDAAMTQAASQEEGVTKAEMLQFMRDMSAQNTNAHATLASSLNAFQRGLRSKPAPKRTVNSSHPRQR